jgi:transcriptional regulator with XRE-family HTH domain
MAKINKIVKIDRHIGRQLRARRRLCRLSLREMADCLGVSVQQFQKYEQGTNRVSAATLFVLAAALDVPATYFAAGLRAETLTRRNKSRGTAGNIVTAL